MEYLPEQDILCLCCFESSKDDLSQNLPQFMIVKAQTGRVMFSKNFPENQKPSAVKHAKLDDKRTMIYVGVSITEEGKNP